MNRRTLFFGAAAAALAPLGRASAANPGRGQYDGVDYFTNVEVIDQNGKKLRFYDDVMKGKILMISFFFTACDNICPLTTDNLVRVQELLGSRMDDEIRMISISLQPEHDTPEVMAAYAKMHGVGPGWMFLTGAKDDIELLRHRLGFFDINAEIDSELEEHVGTVRIANEPMHRWAMSPSLISPSAMVRAVDRVLPRFG
jgi:protein SCO1/2